MRGHVLRVLASCLVLVVSGVIAAGPAQAASVWDPNEPGHRLDIRWVGVYEQTDGRIRMTATFYDRVRLKWFREAPSWHAFSVAFTPDPQQSPYYFLHVLFKNRRLRAELCESGSSCTAAKVVRLDGTALQTRIGFGDRPNPQSGWLFRATSANTTADPPYVIDRTVRGKVS